MADRNREHGSDRGLLLVFTGNGKGKTTAALGLALRALGHDQRVAMIQFIKGRQDTGELRAAQSFGDRFEVHVMGRGFTWKSENLDRDIALARKAWTFACRLMAENRHELVILDELTYLVSYSMISEQDLLEGLSARPEGMNVVATGRGASDGLIEAADLVTEMREIKHPYARGIPARKGVEF